MENHKKWDANVFRESLLKSIDSRERYHREICGRIARKQKNGSEAMRDCLTGEIDVCDALLETLDHSMTAKDVHTEIESLLTRQVDVKTENPKAYENGWAMALDEKLKEVSNFL